jgi:hypothetical protein
MIRMKAAAAVAICRSGQVICQGYSTNFELEWAMAAV